MFQFFYFSHKLNETKYLKLFYFTNIKGRYAKNDASITDKSSYSICPLQLENTIFYVGGSYFANSRYEFNTLSFSNKF